MLIRQLSLFVENRPGTLNAVCQVLKKNNLSIRTLSLADTRQFGILRLLIADHQTAARVLRDAGFLVKETDVLALPVRDEAGGLAEILEVLDRAGIGVEYMYAFPSGRNNRAVMVFRFDDSSAAEQALSAAGIRAVTDGELFD